MGGSSLGRMATGAIAPEDAEGGGEKNRQSKERVVGLLWARSGLRGDLQKTEVTSRRCGNANH